MICERCRHETEDNIPFCPYCGLRFKMREQNDKDGTVMIIPEESSINLNNENTVIVNTDDSIGGFDDNYSGDSDTYFSQESAQSNYVNPIVTQNTGDKSDESNSENDNNELKFDKKNYIPVIISFAVLLAAIAIFIKLVVR